MKKILKSPPVLMAIVGVLTSFAIGFIASFIFEDVSAYEITASTLSVTVILVLIAGWSNHAKNKDEGKNKEKGEK